jgi:Sulfate permease family
MSSPAQPSRPSSYHLPALRLLSAVRGVPASSLSREILAGVTLAALMIPLNVGYAQVAGLPPIVGLYAAILAMIAFALTSFSRHLVASPDASHAAMVAAFLAPLATTGDPRYVHLAIAQALLCGLVFGVCWAFRLGFLANFLSYAVLVSCLRSSRSKASDACQDLVCRLDPDEGLRSLIVCGKVKSDGALQRSDAAVTAAPDLLFGESCKPTLDLVDPGGIRRCEVNMEAWVAEQPTLDQRSFVRAVVVEDQVNIKFSWLHYRPRY